MDTQNSLIITTNSIQRFGEHPVTWTQVKPFKILQVHPQVLAHRVALPVQAHQPLLDDMWEALTRTNTTFHPVTGHIKSTPQTRYGSHQKQMQKHTDMYHAKYANHNGDLMSVR